MTSFPVWSFSRCNSEEVLFKFIMPGYYPDSEYQFILTIEQAYELREAIATGGEFSIPMDAEHHGRSVVGMFNFKIPTEVGIESLRLQVETALNEASKISKLKVDEIEVSYSQRVGMVISALGKQFRLAPHFRWEVTERTIQVLYASEQTWSDAIRASIPTPEAIATYLRDGRGYAELFDIDLTPFKDYLLSPDGIDKSKEISEL